MTVQVHNASAGSSDLTCIPFLSLGYTSTSFETETSPYLKLTNSALHTNFKLDKTGDYIALKDPMGLPVDTLVFENLKADISYGRSIIDLEKTGYMAMPTPGTKNESLLNSFADSVNFSLPGGFYSGQQILILSTSDASDEIYFTTDGSSPNRQSEFFTDSIVLLKTTTIRAFATNSNKIAGETLTFTYFINEDVHLPVVSLVTDADHFFSDESGIYVTGTNGIPGMCDDFRRNLNQDWERPVNIEFYEADGTLQLNQVAGVKIFGGCSRTRYPEKSMAFFARSDYEKGSFRYKFFADKPIDKFESFLLRSAADDQVHTMFRDPLATAVMVEFMDVDYQAYRPVVVYINGEYWGIHNLREKINEHYLSSNFNVDADKTNILDKEGKIVNGDNSTYKAMIEFAEKNDLSLNENYEYIKTQMDVNQYIDYQIANIYLGEGDWPGNNIKFWSADKSAYTRWRWLQYDRDQTFKNTFVNSMEMAAEVNCNCSWPNPPWSTLLFRRLLKNEEFRNTFIQLYAYHMAKTFDKNRLIGFINKFQVGIEDEIPRHITKWGGKKDEDSTEGFPEPTFSTVTQWENNVEVLRSFAKDRPQYAISHIQDYFNLSGRANFTVEQNTEDGGYVKLFHKKLPFTGYSANHFKGVAVELSVVANVGYEFSHWLVSDGTGEKELSEKTISIILTGTTTAKAYFNQAETNEDPIVIINEINYHSADNFNTGDWLELFNRHTDEIELTNWTISDSEDENVFIFPKSTVIKGKNYFIISQKISDFSLLFPLVKNLTGDLGFKLSNAGEVIRLFDASGTLVDSVHYFDSKPWPKEADGDGYTLELIDTRFENDWAENWMSSVKIGGTPGWKNGTEWVSVKDFEYVESGLFSNFNVFPNPVKDRATIEFTLSESSEVNITVLDFMGREVQQIISGKFAAGNYSTVFSRSNLIPGMYLCNFWIEGRGRETLKIVVL